jgi:hypothetical protein
VSLAIETATTSILLKLQRLAEVDRWPSFGTSSLRIGY